MSGTVIVKIELPLDLYAKLARPTRGEVGRLLRTLATRAARMESEELKTIAPVTTCTCEQEEEPEEFEPFARTEKGREKVLQIKRHLEDGMTVTEIARALGISNQAVYHHMKKNNLETPGAFKEDVRNLWLQHNSSEEIARLLGVHPRRIYALVDELNRKDRIA